ncbi:MAG: D-aminoacyl-tRNA deacylase [Polyangiaceae bacterium]
MRAVIQRVLAARVEVDGEVVGAIGPGLCCFVGAGKGDGDQDLDLVATKIAELRIFPDADDKMNLSVRDVGGSVLAVSQFTVYGDARKGRRPSFQAAMHPDEARATFERFVERLRGAGLHVETGTFAAKMRVLVDNDGPVTILVDSNKTF